MSAGGATAPDREPIRTFDDPSCKRCGSSAGWVDCESCNEGFVEEDFGDDVVPEYHDVECHYCRGKGGWWRCLSTVAFCEANPMKGRENVGRGEIE